MRNKDWNKICPYCDCVMGEAHDVGVCPSTKKPIDDFAPVTKTVKIIDRDTDQMYQLTPWDKPGTWLAQKIYEPGGYPGKEKYEEAVAEKLKRMCQCSDCQED